MLVHYCSIRDKCNWLETADSEIHSQFHIHKTISSNSSTTQYMYVSSSPIFSQERILWMNLYCRGLLYFKDDWALGICSLNIRHKIDFRSPFTIKITIKVTFQSNTSTEVVKLYVLLETSLISISTEYIDWVW